jgi:hypothetical protein
VATGPCLGALGGTGEHDAIDLAGGVAAMITTDGIEPEGNPGASGGHDAEEDH